MTESCFQIFTSLRWITGSTSANTRDKDVLQRLRETDEALLPYHRDRLLATAEYFGWDGVAGLLQGSRGLTLMRGKIDDHFLKINRQNGEQITIHKLRIVIDTTGDMKLDSSVIGRHNEGDLAQLPPWIPASLDVLDLENRPAAKVYLEPEPTRPSSYTSYKTTARDVYDQARQRADVTYSGPTEAEVLLWNEENEIMETSLCTPYFLRGGSWITPSYLCGGNRGVSRRRALEGGLCIEGIIHKDEIGNGEKIWLSNAVRGFFPGQVYL